MTTPVPPVQPGGLDGAVRIAHSAVIRVVGADAATFLHSQLTNDFTGLGLGEARLAAFCSAKGRMLASFIGFKQSHEEIWLVCRTDLLPATLQRLRMFVLRAKARLVEGGDEVALVGLSGTAAAAWISRIGAEAASLKVWSRCAVGAASLVRLPDAAGQGRWLWAGAAADAAMPLEAMPTLALAGWDWLEVQSGIAPVMAATREAFVPQMLNYELVGAVNFSKGCYPGQEIVARSQYRGSIKRRTVLLHGGASLQPGQEVFWSGDVSQPSGIVALAAAAPGGGHDALVELKLVALDSGSLHAGSPEGETLAPRPLPYAVPREAEAA